MLTFLLAQPKRDDVFRSISDNVGGHTDPRVLYVGLLCATGLVIILIVANAIKKRQASPRAVNNQGRLIKEMLKALPLKSAEVKHLKTLATEQGCNSPLTLILCPSLIAKGINAKGKADRRVVLGVAKKMGILKKEASRR